MTEEEKNDLGLGICWILVILLIMAAGVLVGGCVSNKASHQNGLVVYVSTSGQVGVGYGETEDMPGGCTYHREVTQVSPALWGSGTNYTRTVTDWDTTAMVSHTNLCTCAANTNNFPSCAQ